MEAAVETAITADRAGFRGIALTHHHFSDYNTYCNPFVFGAYLAPQVKQAWLLLQVVVAPMLNPLALVEDANLIDQLWRGRFIMAMGSGGSPLEFEGLGRDPRKRGELTEQVIAIAKQAWAHKPGDAPIAYRTEHDQGTMRGRIMPAPYRDEHPHFARAGISQVGWEDAGRMGRPLFFGRVGLDGARQAIKSYETALAEGDWGAERVAFCKTWTTMQKTVAIAGTDDEARQLADAPLNNLQRLSQRAFAAYDDSERQAVTGVTGADPDAFRKAFVEGATMIGSPATLIDEVKRYEDVGVRQIALHMNFGFMAAEDTKRSLDLFIDKVMPKVS
jgi:alkanesulfonate monooxygenase SsuD/methylene tetrahydromethanopterin reductase-like flavin-dependent oxidoreductase (luciferase family)